MIFIRSLIFNIYFILTTFLVATFGLPFVFSEKYLCKIGRLWARTALFGLKMICGVKMKLIGEENIPEPPFLVASQHQSALETIAFWVIFKNPIYILKKELTKIPLYGIYLIRMGMIVIDRKAGARSLKHIIEQSLQSFKRKGKVIIFPSGTRTIPGEKVKYKIGLSHIYEKSEVKVLPVVLNTGYFWPSKKFLKYSGEFTIHILPPIEAGLPKVEFETILDNIIDQHTEPLLK